MVTALTPGPLARLQAASLAPILTGAGVPAGASAKSLNKGFATMSRVPSLSSPFLLGFDEIERALDRVTKAADGYPPYNIERISDGGRPDRLRITLAVAGFTRDQLDVRWRRTSLSFVAVSTTKKPDIISIAALRRGSSSAALCWPTASRSWVPT